jgi:hypothetical protein
MTSRIVAWLAIVLTALALVPAAAHLLELPSKVKLADESYFMVQNIYRGWAWLGIVLVAALVADLAWALLLRGQGAAFALVVIASACMAATLAIYLVWAFPANRLTEDWTVMPENWTRLRLQWEAAHAANAALTFAALSCLTGAAVMRMD